MKKIEHSMYDDIINMYLGGMSSPQIADLYRVNYLSIIRALRKCGVEIRTFSECQTKYSVDDSYFEKINNNNKAYFLGLMISDGNVDSRRLRISLNYRDKHILEAFKREIQYDGDIVLVDDKRPNRSQKALLAVTNRRMVKDLTKNGCVAAKSHKTYFPPINKRYWSHFIRGVFDGDGSVYMDSRRGRTFSIIGNRVLISRIQEILIKKCGLSKTKLYKDKRCNGEIVQFFYQGNLQTKRIAEYLYRDAEHYLKRKHKVFNI